MRDLTGAEGVVWLRGEAAPARAGIRFADGAVEAGFLDWYHRRAVRRMRTGVLVALAVYALFGLFDRQFMSAELRSQAWIIRYGVLCPALALIAWALGRANPASNGPQAWAFVGGLVAGLGLMAHIALGPADLATWFAIGPTIIVVMSPHTLFGLRFGYAAVLSCVLSATYVAIVGLVVKLAPGQVSGHILYLALATVIAAYMAWLAEREARSEFVATTQLAAERERTEQLLLNVLPAPVVERLRQGEAEIADDHASVSVLFADLVGFTTWAAALPAAQTAARLNELFSALDDLCEAHGVEKIKTMGDGYMAVSGAPVPHPGEPATARNAHARSLTAFALDALAVVTAWEGDLTLRIGIHSGPVVAGILGKRKFVYDVWGDTVNTASRMESHGEPGAIQISAATADLLGDAYVLTPRGEVEIKGKGPMSTFLIRPDGQER